MPLMFFQCYSQTFSPGTQFDVCFNVNLILCPFIGLCVCVSQAADLTRPVDKRLYRGTSPTCHDFNSTTAAPDRIYLVVGFSAGQVQLLDPIGKENSKLFNEEVCRFVSGLDFWCSYSFFEVFVGYQKFIQLTFAAQGLVLGMAFQIFLNTYLFSVSLFQNVLASFCYVKYLMVCFSRPFLSSLTAAAFACHFLSILLFINTRPKRQ